MLSLFGVELEHLDNRCCCSLFLFFLLFPGTSKIATNCTSTMTVQLDQNGKARVNVCYTHYGHGKSLEHLRVPTRQREMIAAKMKNGVSRQRILDDIRESVSENFHRQHLINRQDLANFERAFALQNVQRHSNDLQSVLAWISEWKSEKGEESPVLYLKVQGEGAKDGYNLPIDDFIMVVQTPFQREMFLKFAVNGICCDSTHGTNGYDYPLTTIHVIDDFGEGMPVAWCLSNHEDICSMVVFFSEIKMKCGPVQNAFFMSDMANQFYNAWVAIMGPKRPAKLLCTWHVDKAWKEELRKKVGDVVLEAEIYKMIRTCLEQTSENYFEDCLSGLLNYLESEPKAVCFRNYFVKEWVSKKTQWAYCFRLRMGINTNMFSEAFHRVFKRVYLGGKTNKHIDYCLVNLVKFSRDKAFDRGIKLTKGKQTYRMRSIMAEHSHSLEIPNSLVQKLTEDKWLISSQNSQQKHEVCMVAPTCADKDQCKMVCPDCKVCPHLFQCNCPDSLIKGIICKHVHAVQHVTLETATNQQDTHRISNELQSLSSYLRVTPCVQTTQIKESIKGKLASLEHQIELCDNLEVLQTLSKQLSAASSCFSAFNKYGQLPKQPSTQLDSHANKKMETQRRLYSTKKKRIKRAAVRYSCPTWEERETYQTILTALKPCDPSNITDRTLGEESKLCIQPIEKVSLCHFTAFKSNSQICFKL